MRVAAGLAVLACGMAAAWLVLWPAPGDAHPELCAGLVAGSLAAGWLIGRGRHKPVLIAGLVVLGAASGCLAVASRAWLPLAMGALGLGAGMTFLAANAAVPAAGRGGRASALNLLNLPLPLGVAAVPFFGATAVGSAAMPVAAVALGFALWTRMPPTAPAPEKRPAIPRLALLLFLYAVCEAATWTWLAEYWRVAHVLDIGKAWLILCCGVPLGLVAGRAGASRVLAAVAPLTVVRFAGFALAFATALMLLARSPSAACVAAFVAGLAMAPVLPTLLALAGDGLGMAAALAAGWLGMAVSGPLIAGIAARSSLPTAMTILPLVSLAMAQVAAMAK